MQQNRQKDGTEQPNHEANRGHGPQGIDKAPGEEPSQDNVNFTQEAFKGKKVDGDPEKEEDKPSDQAL